MTPLQIDQLREETQRLMVLEVMSQVDELSWSKAEEVVRVILQLITDIGAPREET